MSAWEHFESLKVYLARLVKRHCTADPILEKKKKLKEKLVPHLRVWRTIVLPPKYKTNRCCLELNFDGTIVSNKALDWRPPAKNFNVSD